MIPEVRGGKSFGTAGRGNQVFADVEVPIVRTGKPVVTVVGPIRKNVANIEHNQQPAREPGRE